MDRFLLCKRLGEKLVKDFYNDFSWNPTGIQSLVTCTQTDILTDGTTEVVSTKKVHFYFAKIIISFCCQNKMRHAKMWGKNVDWMNMKPDGT